MRRLLSLVALAWALGFVWFAAALPQPARAARTDAIVVPTGSGGRIPRGVALLQEGAAGEMLVTGVDTEVNPVEFAAEYGVPQELMDCCITLGFTALDTRGNARETASWMEQNGFASLRLVTSDWHMRRVALELRRQLPAGVTVLRDAVRTEPSLWTLFIEYHKLIATWAVQGGVTADGQSSCAASWPSMPCLLLREHDGLCARLRSLVLAVSLRRGWGRSARGMVALPPLVRARHMLRHLASARTGDRGKDGPVLYAHASTRASSRRSTCPTLLDHPGGVRQGQELFTIPGWGQRGAGLRRRFRWRARRGREGAAQ